MSVSINPGVELAVRGRRSDERRVEEVEQQTKARRAAEDVLALPSGRDEVTNVRLRCNGLRGDRRNGPVRAAACARREQGAGGEPKGWFHP